MSIINKIKDYHINHKDKILFTTPSHSLGEFLIPQLKEMLGEKYFKCDFSEIEGFDNLRDPTGILKELQNNISNIYKTKQSFILTNGSSSGIVALMLSVLRPGDKVLIARNSHVSVYNGLVLSGAVPIWFMPEYDKKWSIFSSINPKNVEEIIKSERSIKALIMTSPTYEGVFSDIKAISDICQKHNIVLIVDEAHGALLNFGEFQTKPAVLSGADASVQSLHKTAGAPNPCALLHIAKDTKIDISKVQESLNIISTTSPSYPLMLAVEATVKFLTSSAGAKKIQELLEAVKRFKETLNPNISVYTGYNDPTKLLIKIKGYSGIEACEILNNKYLIEEEFSNSSAMLFLTGIGTENSKLDTLKNALNSFKTNNIKIKINDFKYKLPKQMYTPREAYFKNSSEIESEKFDSAVSQISAEVISAYPPGIPIVLPGEVLTKDIVEYSSNTLNHNSFKIIQE